MIFVTVGTDLPFDRLVRQVDQWALKNGRTDIFAQIGDTDFKPTQIAHKRFLEPLEFRERIASASMIISHAGMGSILSALLAEKPILIMPRRASLGEQRNEHQLATASRLLALGKVNVASDEAELGQMLDRLNELKPLAKIGPFADKNLLAALGEFIAKS